MLRIGIFADKYMAVTGFARVCNSLAKRLANKHMVYYFGRFGNEDYTAPIQDGFMRNPAPSSAPFLYVPCIGGVWDREVCVNAINHYKLDVVFTEDDWFSSIGIAKAAEFCNKPFHFHTPIDSLPIHPASKDVFKLSNTIYVPNSSYQIIQKKGFNSVFLPHGVNSEIFKPFGKKPEGFHFLLIGRNEDRKAIGRAIIAYKNIYKAMDAKLIIHTDWNVESSQNMRKYIHMNFDDVERYFVFSQMQNNPASSMNILYNLANVNICTSKAGGFEMSITEAAAAQVPSIVTNWTFMNENVVNGKTGWLIPHSHLITEPQYGRMWANIDIESLSARMFWCYTNKEYTNQAGIQAREYVTETFKWDDIANTLRENIEKSVKK